MAITQTIATLPAVLNDSATFYEDIAERNNSLVTTVFPSINAWATQANALKNEMSDLSITTQEAATSAMTSESLAQGYANYKGDWKPTTSYAVGQTVDYDGSTYICKVANTLQFPNVASSIYWKVNEIGRYTGFKNYIINGGFDVWQRGSNAFNVTGTKIYMADAFHILSTREGCYWNWAKSTDVPSSYFKSSLLFGMTTADFSSFLINRIEGVHKLSSKTATLSFWAKCTSGTLTTSNMNIQQNFGVGGDTEVDISPNEATKNATLTTAWQKFTYTFTLPTVSGKIIGTSDYLEVSFALNNTTEGVYITGFQLEEGSIATQFENLDIALTETQCRRYYRRYATQQNVANLAYEMRTTPTEAGTAPYTYSAEL